MPNNPEDFPIFTELDDEEITLRLKKLERHLLNLPEFLGIDTNSLLVDIDSLNKIIGRIEKRRVYFHIFHRGMQMGELNEISLYCFWILKLSPFKSGLMETSELNSRIALHIFTTFVQAQNNLKGKPSIFTLNLVNSIYYNFRYRDLSKEAIMALAEMACG